MNLEGNKISTSRNWAVWVHEYLKEMPGREDELRYYLTKNMPEQKDSEFTWKGFQEALNSELVAIFGNFINRSLVLMHKLCQGKVPPLHTDILDDTDRQLLADIARINEARVGQEESNEADTSRLAIPNAQET